MPDRPSGVQSPAVPAGPAQGSPMPALPFRRPAPLPDRLARLGRTAVMGILNVTPDSFSDGGQYVGPAEALAHAEAMVAAGADLVDVGGESTRPGAARVPAEEEARRVLPVVRELVGRGIPVSVDTTRARVAARAVEAGAVVVNDVSGGLADPDMARVVAETGAVLVVTHWRGPSGVMDSLDRYGDVVREVTEELKARVDALVGAGIGRGQIVLDPGFGFAKRDDSNWPLLRHLDVLQALGFPLLVGVSRKRFLGSVLAGSEPGAVVPPPRWRDSATAAVSALVAAQGVWCVRVHAVAPSADAVKVAARWRAA